VTENVGLVFAPATSRPTVPGAAAPVPASTQSQSGFSVQHPAIPSTSGASVAAIVSHHLDGLAPQVAPQPVIGHAVPVASTGFPNTNSFTSHGKGAASLRPATGTSGGAGGDAGGGVSGTFMGVEGTGRKFVYVLDRSMSTGFGQRRSPLFVAKTELLASLQSLGDAGIRESKPIQFQVLFFNQDTAVFNTVGFGGSDHSGRLLRYDQTAFDKLQRFLGGVLPDGGTKPEPALMQAIRLGADCIFFMTDGGTQLHASQLQRIRQTARGVQINVVEYGMGARSVHNNSLRQLAEENHGNHVYVDLSQRPR